MSALNPFTGGSSLPDHLQRGQYGEKLARRFLQRRGLKYLTRNYAYVREEIELHLKDFALLADRTRLSSRASKRNIHE